MFEDLVLGMKDREMLRYINYQILRQHDELFRYVRKRVMRDDMSLDDMLQQAIMWMQTSEEVHIPSLVLEQM